jgi:prepilin-type N-terminal cleavage/methylation domain-containing protein
MRRDPTRWTRGFTLIELLVVMAIIGLLITFILIAAQDGIRRAQEKATLSLVSKLDIAVSERLDALLYRRSDVYPSHFNMAQIYDGAGKTIPSLQRAQVIAEFDLVRAQMPDVFFVQVAPASLTATKGVYPINFAGLDYPLGSGDYTIPIGTGSVDRTKFPLPLFPQLGAYGATFQAAAGIYKNLGYLPQGYDGADNNNDGFIDDVLEGVGTGANSAAILATIKTNLAAHTHNTARSEMLYAILVEGQGPLGSVFTRDDFSSKEVGDTDGDGLPEFIDAWGHPLQFYRWPIYYSNDLSASATISSSAGSYIQKGLMPYTGVAEARQIDALDPNQTLVSIGWWASSVNSQPIGGYTAAGTYSAGASAFMHNFHSLLEPYYLNPKASATVGTSWDRSGFFDRREFYGRFLIASAGPDQQLGIAQLNQDYHSIYPSSSQFGGPPLNLPSQPRDTSGTLIQFPAASINASVLLLTTIENQAAPIDPNRSGTLNEQATYYPFGGFPYANDTTSWLQMSGQDDITNLGLASPGGGVR